MFNGPDFPKPLDEEVFTHWLEDGRQSKIAYNYLLVVWDDYDAQYRPVYVRSRDEIGEHASDRSSAREWLVAAYDLYSESRIFWK